MDIKMVLKNYLQQKEGNVFHQVFQCLQYLHLKAYKISLIYAEVKINEKKKFWESLRQHAMKIINFKEKKRRLLANEQHRSSQN